MPMMAFGGELYEGLDRAGVESASFAMSEQLPSPVWNAISILLKAEK